MCERGSEHRNIFIVPQQVEQLKLCEEGDDADTREIQVVVLEDRCEAHQFTCAIDNRPFVLLSAINIMAWSTIYTWIDL